MMIDSVLRGAGLIVGPGRRLNQPLSPRLPFLSYRNDKRFPPRIVSYPLNRVFSGLQPVTHGTSIQYTILKERRIKMKPTKEGGVAMDVEELSRDELIKLAKAAQRQREAQQKYYAANKDRITAAQRRYYQANKERIVQAKRKYYAENRDKVLQSRREQREKRKREAVRKLLSTAQDVNEALKNTNKS